MKVIYMHGHPAVTLPDGRRVVRHGEPVEVSDKLGRELVARGDFIEYVPEPSRRPVEKSSSKQ